MLFYTNVAQVKGQLLVRGYDAKGNQVMERVRYKPSLYVEYNGEGDYKTLDGTVVQRIEKKSIYEAHEYLKSVRDVSNKVVYGYDQYAYTYINERFPGNIEYDPELIRVANIDIETESDEGMPDVETAVKGITAITVQFGTDILSLGLGDYEPSEEDVTYIKCDTEEEMLEKFLQAWEWYSPDVVTGWYIENFDIPYIVNRLRRLLGDEAPKRLSPWKHLREKNVLSKGEMRRLYFPTGVALLDYIKIYKKMELEPRESYSLNYIASVEVGARKLDYSEYETLAVLYKENFSKFMDYNILDVRLVSQIEAKKQMLKLTYQMAYKAHCNFEDINSPVRMWECIVYNDLIDRNIVFPPRQRVAAKYGIDPYEMEEEEDLEGGYVKDPIVGLHKWVVSVDLNSLYPHLIMQYNISPETRRGSRTKAYDIEDYLNSVPDDELERLISEKLVSAGNGCLYDKDSIGFLPRLLQQMYDDRVEYKAKMLTAMKQKEITTSKAQLAKLDNEIAKYKNMQMVYKVALNSAYGALSNEWFRFYNFDNADSVTSSGRLAIRWIEKKLNEWMNKMMFTDGVDYVIASDTDSIYLNFGPLMNKKYEMKATDKLSPEQITSIVNLLDQTVKYKVEPFIDECYRELQKKVNSAHQKMVMKRESIADTGIWTGKKRYVLNIWDKEGVRYKEPKIEIKGMDSVRSSTPAACRQAIKDLIKVCIYEDEVAAQKFIADFKKRFSTLPFDEIAFPRGIKGLEKYSDDAMIAAKGTPVQVRGALVYNHMIREKQLHSFTPIYDGDKIKFCYLVEPNAVRSYVIAVPNAIPKGFDIDDKINYDKQFEIGFMNPVDKILTAMGWRKEHEGNTLDAFMARRKNVENVE